LKVETSRDPVNLRSLGFEGQGKYIENTTEIYVKNE